MKSQRQIDQIRWQDHIYNTQISPLTGLGYCSHASSPELNSWIS